MPHSRRAAAPLLALLLVASTLAGGWYASAEPNVRRNWDERYSLRNVHGILAGDSLRPVFPWYPALAYLPQTALLAASRAVHRTTGIEWFDPFQGDGSFGPTAYLLSRWLNVLFGTGCVLLTFVAGRRLFSPGVGLLAASLLAATPWQIRAAAVFKPDPLLLLLILATFLWSLSAAEEGGLRAYLLAGAGVGLAASAKQTGALASIPLAAATLLEVRRTDRWLKLAAAAAVSVAVFLVINPWPDLLPGYLSMGERYQRWADSQRAAAELPPTPLFALRLLLDSSFHGPFVGAAALAGFVGLVARLYRRWRDPREAARLTLLLGFPIGYTLVCWLVSDYPKANILHPLAAFSSIAAAWLIAAGWRELGGSPVGRRVRWPAAAALAILVAWPSAVFVYRGAIAETTLRRAGFQIAARAPFLAQRSVVYESDAGALEAGLAEAWDRWVAVVAQQEAALADLDPAILDLSDYEIFREGRLHEAGRELYLERIARVAPGEAWTVKPVPLRRRGSRLVVVAHPWWVRPPALAVDWRRAGAGRQRLTADLPRRLRSGEVISFDLRFDDDRQAGCDTALGGASFPTFTYRRDGTTVWRMSRRFRLRSPRLRFRLTCPAGIDLVSPPRLAVWRWSADPPVQ